MRGVIQGAAQHELDVAVTVAPPDEWDKLATRPPAPEAAAGPTQSQSQTPA
jgi:hypothetical protein